MLRTTRETGAIPSLAGPRQWLGLAVLALPTLLSSMDATVLYLAMPNLAADLRPSANQTLWIIDVYGFMIAGFLVVMGGLGDRIGRRRLLMIGAAVFAAASALAALATDPAMLIAARALLGIAGATLMPSTLALISTMFRDPAQRGMAIGVWATCLSAGVAIGPIAGGLLLNSFWWGSVFLLALPVMALLLVTAPFLLPEFRDTEAGRIDLRSAALSVASVLPLVFGIKQFAKEGFDAAAIAAAAIGLLFGFIFVRRQRVLASPLVDLRMFTDRSFRTALLLLLVAMAMVSGMYLFLTQYLQLVADLSPLAAGLWLLPAAAGLILTSMTTPIMVRRVSPGLVAAGAMAVSATGYVVLAMTPSADGLPIATIGLMLVYLGCGPIMVLGTDLVVATAPPERAGSAASLSETSLEFGLASGVALLGVLGAAVYRGDLTAHLPTGTSPESAAASRESLDAAMASAADLPPAEGTALLDAARHAFTTGLGTVATVCAVAAAALAIAVLRSLRTVAIDPGSEH